MRSNDDIDHRAEQQKHQISTTAPQLASHIRLHHFPLGGSVTHIPAPGDTVPSGPFANFCCFFLCHTCSDLIDQQVLSTMQRYPTKVDYCVLTNQPERLKLAIQPWALPEIVCGSQKNMSHPFKLAWEHRTYMEQAFQHKDPGEQSPCSQGNSSVMRSCFRVRIF